MRSLIWFHLIGAAGAILFAGSVVADDWPYYQHDPSHTGNSSAVVDPQALSLIWTAPSLPTGYSTPLIVGNSIYAMQNQQGISTSQTTVSSFNLSTGAINWSYTGNFAFPSQPGVGGGFVAFVGSTLASPVLFSQRVPGANACNLQDTSQNNLPCGVASSLYVLDATSGSLLYTVPVPESLAALMPIVVRDPTSGGTTAFIANIGQLSAVSLRPPGSVLWTQYGDFGGLSIPTVVGSSIVLAGPGQYYAFDQATGAVNHFWIGPIAGGGGTTVAYDAARQQFYVLELYDAGPATLSAYQYVDNDNITLLWQRTGDGVGYGGSVAIGPTGNVYSAGGTVVWELDPTTGATLRSISGSFANGVTPALTNNVLWINGLSQVFAYDLVTLHLLRAFSGASLNIAYDGPGAFADGYFVRDYGGYSSFDVYRVPTSPSPTPTPCVRCEPTPRPRPTAAPRPTP